MKNRYVIATILVWLAGCASQPPAPKDYSSLTSGSVVLLHQSNRYGTLEPCGCEISPFGGIDREANAVKMTRAQGKPVLYVDAGNLYGPVASTAPVAIELAKSKYLTEMLNSMGLDVFAPGPGDYRLGLEALKNIAKQAKFSFISSNVRDRKGALVFAPYQIIERGGVPIAVLAVSSTENLKATDLKVQDPVEAVTQLLPEIRSKSRLVVLLSQLGNHDDNKLAEKLGVDVIVGADPAVTLDEGEMANTRRTLIVDSADRGYRLGRLDLNLNFPLLGFNSITAMQKQNEEIKSAAQQVKRHPKSKSAKQVLAGLLNQPKLTLLEGGSWFTSAVVPLDPARFGTPNEVTQIREKYRQSLRESAISE